jgi:hypothetical protein
MAAAANEPSEGGEIWGEDPGILEESKTRHELYAASRSENRLQNKPHCSYRLNSGKNANHCRAFSVQLRLPTSHCRVYFKWTVATLLSQYKEMVVPWDWRCNKGKLYGLHLFKYILASLWSTTMVNTLKSHLNTSGQANSMFAGRQLQWPLTV